MKMILGLGNPGSDYVRTRHNAGFRVIDELIRRKGWAEEREKRSKLGGQTVRYRASLRGTELVAVKPLSFMNASGSAFMAALKDFDLTVDAVLVVLDDVSLPLGKLRLKPSGTSGGQKGLEDILNVAGADAAVARLRFGVGNENLPQDLAAFVLSDFWPDEEKILAGAVARAADAAEAWAACGIDAAMNKFN
jgi:PTH1 family peptidyl-tRNA hydrolase